MMTKAIKLNDIIKYRCVLYSEHCEVYNLVCSQYIASQFWIHNKPADINYKYKLPKIVLKDRMTRNQMGIPYTCSFIDLYKYMQCKEHSRTFDIPTQPTCFWEIQNCPPPSLTLWSTTNLRCWNFGCLKDVKTAKSPPK